MRRFTYSLVFVSIVAASFLFSRPSRAIQIYNASLRGTTDGLVFKMTHKGSPPMRRVYLDRDNSSATGFIYEHGIGADFMIENGVLYRYPHIPASTLIPVWQKVGKVTYIPQIGKTKWKIPWSLVNRCPHSLRAVFETEKTLEDGTIKRRISGVISGAPSCAVPTPEMPPNPPMDRDFLVPAYIYVDEGVPFGCTATEPDCEYHRLVSSGAAQSIVVINPENGPGSDLKPEYVELVDALQQTGIKVLGYVSTNYGERPRSDVTLDIGRYISRYGVDGIFLDEMEHQDCKDATHYQYIYNQYHYVSDTLIVANPGTNFPKCYLYTADIFITYEGTAADYAAWQPSAWTNAYPEHRFAHLIHTAPEDDLNALIALWESRNVGMIYVTDDVMPNPWDTLPTYWEMLNDQVNTP